MPFTVEQSIEIDAPIQEVWDYVVEHDEWRQPLVVEVRKLNGGPHGVGSRYEDRFRVAGMSGAVVNELTHFDPPTRMSWIQPEKKPPVYVVEGSYLLEELGEGRTRFTLRNAYQPRGPFRLLAPLIRRKTERDHYPMLLGQLKDKLEDR